MRDVTSVQQLPIKVRSASSFSRTRNMGNSYSEERKEDSNEDITKIKEEQRDDLKHKIRDIAETIQDQRRDIYVLKQNIRRHEERLKTYCCDLKKAERLFHDLKNTVMQLQETHLET